MIDINGLSVCYGEMNVITDISLTFPAGSLTCIIGPNGCGKTTLLKAAAGLIPISNGSVTINNKPIVTMKGTERAKRIAYLPQSRPVPDMTVLTMIRHGRFPHMGFARKLTKADNEAVEAAIELTSTKLFLDKLVAELSGGERQRVYIAMAIAQGADTMLLDEPAAGLDLRYQVELMQIVDRLHKQGKTIVMVTHDLPLAFSAAERVCLLNGGRLLRCAEPEDSQLQVLLPEVFGYALRKADIYGDELYRYQIIKGV